MFIYVISFWFVPFLRGREPQLTKMQHVKKTTKLNFDIKKQFQFPPLPKEINKRGKRLNHTLIEEHSPLAIVSNLVV